MRVKTQSSLPFKSHHASRKAFTLVELMVVIGIIAVLMALVMPAISNARTGARVAAVTATISVLDTGIEQYRADSKIGGSYPPSWYFNYISPHTGGDAEADRYWVGGASLLAWALVGADMLGTPGFRDLDGDMDWWNNTGSNYNPNALTNLYSIFDTTAEATLQYKPVHPRYGPFVDISKMSFPQRDRNGPDATSFIVPAAQGNYDDRILKSICFLDTFDQPILYYRANPGVALPICDDVYPNPATGIYNVTDNIQITGDPLKNSIGMNFGAGYAAGTDKYYHYLGVDDNDVFANAWPADNGTPCFLRTIWNPNVTATLRPQRMDSYILLSAGPDGIFGTADDIGNFEINK